VGGTVSPVIRQGTVWMGVTAVVVATASVTAAASDVIGTPASVVDPAQRLNPTFEPDLTPEERAVYELIALVNVERATRGLPNLFVDARVTEAARAHAADMAANRRMQHVGSDGSDGGIRLARTGYEWSSWGENIGAGFVDPLTLFQSWMNSPDHRANLLGDSADVGVGVVATPDGVPYWALLVATTPYVPTGF